MTEDPAPAGRGPWAERNRRALAAAEPADGLRRRTAQGAGISAVAQAVSILVQLGTTAVLARLLTPEDFGLVAMVLPIVALIAMISQTGITFAIIQRPEISHAMVSALFVVNLAAAGALVLLVWALAPLIAAAYGEPRVEPLVAWTASAALLTAAGAQHLALLRRGMRWTRHYLCTLLGLGLGSLAAVAAAVLLEAGHWALVVNLVAGAAFTSALAWAATGWVPSLAPRLGAAREAIHLGAYLSGSGLIGFLQRSADNVLIGWYWGAETLGFYSRAFNLTSLPQRALVQPVSATLVPALSRLAGAPEEWRRLLLEASGLVAVGSGALAAVLLAGAADAVRIVYGPGWDRAATIMGYLALSLFTVCLRVAINWVYLSLGNTRRQLLYNLWVGLPVVALAFGIGVQYDAEGMALAYTLSTAGLMVPALWIACRGTPMRALEMLRWQMPYTLGGLALGLALLWLDPWPAGAGALGRLLLDGAAVALGMGALVLLYPRIDPAHRPLLGLALRAAGAALAKFRGRG